MSGTLAVRESGRPLPGMLVVAAKVAADGYEVLGETVSGHMGRFRVAYAPLPEPANLTLFVFTPEGRLLMMEPVHLAIFGAELRLQVEVPWQELAQDYH